MLWRPGSLAWRLVEDLYNEQLELIDDLENTFFVALGDLALEAWEARRKRLSRGQDTPEYMPQFRLLWDKIEERGQMPYVPDPHGFISLALTDYSDLN